MRDGWVELSLGELTENTRPICYGVLKPGPNVEGGVPLVKITDMDRRILGPEGMQQISNELDNEFRRSRLQGGEVLLSIQGTVGRVAIAASTLEGANISRTIAVIDPDDRGPCLNSLAQFRVGMHFDQGLHVKFFSKLDHGSNRTFISVLTPDVVDGF